jgi:hypothetical protein
MPQTCYDWGMLGRALFSLVCLIIAAGVLLPMYSSDVEAPGAASADPAIVLADLVASDCRDCAPDAAKVVRCRIDCPCDHSLPASSDTPEASLSLSVHLIVGRPSEQWWLAFKLPSI